MTDKQIKKLKVEQVCKFAGLEPASARSWLESAHSHIYSGRSYEQWVVGMWIGNLDTAKIIWDVATGKYMSKLHRALQ
jgi:hypothetical protein